MPDFQRSVVIDAPVDTVFDFATDFDNTSAWMPKIVRVEVLGDGPVGPGTRFKETRLMGKRECSAVIEIIDHERPSRHVARSKAFGVDCRYDFRFTPDGEGTRVELLGTANGRFLGKLLAPMMLKMIQKEDGDILDRLKQAVESK